MKLGWSSPKIDEFVDKLDKLRSSLTLATVLAFRTSAERNNEEVLAHLRGIKQEHQARQINETKVQTTIQHLMRTVQNHTGDTINIFQREIQVCLNEINALRDSLGLADRTSGKEREILNWLNFRQISWRYEGVERAYQETYGWIFSETNDHKTWDDFTEHLESNVTKPYFINGKAGSGKSTLMKFIHNHTRTFESLKSWSGASELVVLNFFFWNLGTDLQKSQAGLLRALLHDMLERFPELIPAVLPRLYRNWKSSDADVEPHYVEIKSAFELMIEKSRYLNLTIFVDGIDEFEGDHRDMSLFLLSIASPRVKLIVSSRPLNACLAALSDCPTLHLQDLTRKDMEAYVHGELSSHRLMVRLSQQFPDTAPHISVDLVDKAEGVFLWVTLVVRLLLNGLENGDNLAELQTTLRLLPSDLKDLYERMFKKMQGAYQKQAAIIFQLLQRWNEVVHDQPLPGLVLSYATCAPTIVFSPTNVPITNGIYDWTMDALERKIRSRCCGLLEIRYNDKAVRDTSAIIANNDTLSIDEVNRSSVTYIHRTVSEFIKADEVWHGICDLTCDMPFDASTSLASACLFCLRLGARFDDRTTNWYLTGITHFIRTAAHIPHEMMKRYLNELDHTMSELRETSYKTWFQKSLYWQQHWSAQPDAPYSRTASNIMEQRASIYTFAANKGLFRHPIELPPELSGDARFAIVYHALRSWLEGDKCSFQTPRLEERVKTLSHLFLNVSPLDSSALGHDVWDLVLATCNGLLKVLCTMEAAHLLRVSLATTACPRSLWQQCSASGLSGASILESLRSRMMHQSSREAVDVIKDIETLSRMNKNTMLSAATAHDLPPARDPIRNGRSKGKKSRRNKKLKLRATG
jgi:hypothetical protein